jgi:hypothetical protein
MPVRTTGTAVGRTGSKANEGTTAVKESVPPSTAAVRTVRRPLPEHLPREVRKCLPNKTARSERLRKQAWREQCKAAYKKGESASPAPDNNIMPPVQRRLLLTDSTFEKLHEILSNNLAGGLVIRDELTGWLSDLGKQGRESERGFYLQTWNGDGGFTVDRIGHGSIHVPAAI